MECERKESAITVENYNQHNDDLRGISGLDYVISIYSVRDCNTHPK